MQYTTKKIRKMFLDFFKENNHKIIESSSLIPQKNSNLLFTNAGMNQFQNIFLGKEKYQFQKVATVQKCLRTGGKHNDLEQVGYSQYHHTFFEMLGNFSFGDYFKKEAILYAWKLLTDRNWFNLPKEKILVTVYQDDNESYNIWKNLIGLSVENIILIGNTPNNPYVSDNFWQMGETGPCGPCTEIFFKKSNDIFKISHLKDKKKYIEIWNIVFIQFNRINQNKIIPLPIFSVDTGMGLERIASILQNVNSNYEIDIFKELKKSILKINNLKKIKHTKSLNVISDHIRASVFIIQENILPDNEHRGYVLRRIIRRALRHGEKLGIKNPFFYKIVPDVIKCIKIFGEKIRFQQNNIKNILKKEELQFTKTLQTGLKLLKSEIKKIKNHQLDGKTVFYLYDTIGFPIDLTQDICKEYQINININELKNEINKKKRQSKQNKNKIKNLPNVIQNTYTSTFKGYNHNKITCIVKQIFVNQQAVNKILPEEKGIIILDRSPFYGESGGQIGDSGIIYNSKSLFHVQNTQNYATTIIHIGQIKIGSLEINDLVTAHIDEKKRKLIQNNHSATHLLQHALNKILKKNIIQKGSYISEKYLRFDFSYNQEISIKEIFCIEKLINKNIQKNINICDDHLNFEEAKNQGYIFFQNKTYNSIVRTLKIGNISKELCKGTHAHNTGNIGLFKIIYEKSISRGIRRIEAVTGKKALKHIYNQYKKNININKILKSNHESIIPKIKKLIINYKNLEQSNKQLNKNIIAIQTKELINKIIQIKKINFLNSEIKIKDRKLLKNMIDQLKNKIHTGIIILFYKKISKNIFMVGVTNNLTNIIQSNKIIEIIKKYANGSGGGKAEIAECITENINNLDQLINYIKKWIELKI
ncbi:alanine--tRNA ligase [Buchnera aphidicola]|uniref:alanine--tRNA ligase n=1 Tax=Buchnera aphidicola TaxID=9 RepID=UPI003464E2F1